MTKYIIYFTDECGFKHCVIKRKSSTVLSEIKDWLKSHESGETPLEEITIKIA
jgi:hypothetical protein